MNEDMNGNKKLFWKESSNLAQGKNKVRKIWKAYFEDLCIIDTLEEVAAQICGFDGISRGNYFGGEPIGRAEVEVIVGKLKTGKAEGKDENTGEMIKGGGDSVVDWIRRLCNSAFESSVVSED